MQTMLTHTKNGSVAAFTWLKAHWKLVVLAIVIGLPSLALANFLFSEPEPEVITDTVRQGDLTQTVEAVGTIISEKDLELKFPVSGIVRELLVDEGDVVEAGQVLARLRGASLEAAVTSAQARLTTAYAELRVLEEGSRPEDIAIAEAELENKQAALELAQSRYQSAITSLERAEAKLVSLQSEAEIALQGEVAIASSTLSKELSTAQTALGVIEDVFEDTIVQNIVIQSQPYEFTLIETRIDSLQPALRSAITNFRSVDDYREALTALQTARVLAGDASAVVQDAYTFIANEPETGLFDYTKRESLKGTLATQKTNMQTALSNIDAAVRTLQNKSATYETQIAAEQSAVTNATNSRDQAQIDIQTFRTAVQISQANLNLKRAGSRQADIDASRGRVQQARADLQRAQADLDDTYLRAPIDGVITKVNLKEGEFTPGQFSETQAAITILGSSPYRLEVFAAEIDIPKVRIGQSGTVLLDAFPGRDFPLVVSEVDPAATIVDGVPKYRIVLDFEQPDEGFKIGMTGDTDIITDTKRGVLYVPARAVVTNEVGDTVVRIIDDDGIVDVPVTTGLETITDIEITSGLQAGDEIIVLIRE